MCLARDKIWQEIKNSTYNILKQWRELKIVCWGLNRGQNKSFQATEFLEKLNDDWFFQIVLINDDRSWIPQWKNRFLRPIKKKRSSLSCTSHIQCVNIYSHISLNFLLFFFGYIDSKIDDNFNSCGKKKDVDKSKIDDRICIKILWKI